MGGHARHGQAAHRTLAGAVIAAALPVGIGHDRLSADLMKGDVLRRVAGGSGDRQGAEHALRIARHPFQHLHAPHGAADHGEQPFDAELIQKSSLRPDHVADGDHREIQTVRLFRSFRGLHRSGCSHATAENIGANDEIAIRVDWLARADDHLPPAAFAGDRVRVSGELVAGQGMTDENGVAAITN